MFANFLSTVSDTMIDRLGWVLVHSLWQFTAVALLAFLLNQSLRRATSSLRYLTLLAALLLTVVLPVVTYSVLPTGTNSEVQVAGSAETPATAIFGALPEIPRESKPIRSETSLPVAVSAAVADGGAVEPAAVSTKLPDAGPSWEEWGGAVRPWLSAIVAGWCCGVLLFSVRPVVSWLNVRRLRCVGVSPVADCVVQSLQRLQRTLKIRRSVDVLQSTLVNSPVVVGCFRSIILLPTSFVAGVPISQLEAILAHELAHVKRFDYLTNLLQTLVETLFFYHPAVWWLSHRIRMEREHCCDDLVVAALDDRVEYGRALLAVEELRGKASALAMSASGSSLVGRVRRLFQEPNIRDERSGAGLAGLLVLAAGLTTVVVGATVSFAVDEDEVADAAEDPLVVIARTADGITVELHGVADTTPDSQTCWRANGTVIPRPANWPKQVTAGINQNPTHGFVFRVNGITDSQSVVGRIPGQWAWPERRSIASEVFSASTRYPNEVTADLEVGISTEDWGPWQRVETDGTLKESVQPGAMFQDVYKSVTPHVHPNNVSQALRTGLELEGIESTQASLDYEINAIDASGARHACRGVSRSKRGMIIRYWSLEIGDIGHFEYRLRPYQHWVTFRNVSLRAGNQTDASSTVQSIGVPPDAAEEIRTRIHGMVVDANDAPVPRATISARPHKGEQLSATANDQGQFEFFVNNDARIVSLSARDSQADTMWVGKVHLNAKWRKSDEPRMGIDEPLSAKLVPAIASQVTVVDPDGKPVSGATVVVQDGLTEVEVVETDVAGRATIQLPEAARPMIMAFKSGVGYDYFSADVRDENNYRVKNPPKLPEKLKLQLNGSQTVRIKAVDSQGQPVAGVTLRPWYVRKEGNPGDTNFGSSTFNQVTDSNGMATFDWLPPNVQWAVVFWTTSEGYDADRLTVEWKDFESGHVHEVTLIQLTELSGRVVDAEDRPVAGATVNAPGQGVGTDSDQGRAVTDADGHYRMKVPPDAAYVAHVSHGKKVGYVSPIVVREGKPATDSDIKLVKGTVIRGKVTRGTPPEPVAAQWVSLRLNLGRIPGEIDALRKPGDNTYHSVSHSDGLTTDAKGEFRFVAAPGEYVLFGPRQAKQYEFTVIGEPELSFDFHVPGKELMQFTGKVVGPDQQPVAEAAIYGVYEGTTHARHAFTGKTAADATFDIERETQPAMMRVLSADRTLGAIVDVDGELEQRQIELKPTSRVSGRLLNDKGEPFAEATVKYGVKVYQGGMRQQPVHDVLRRQRRHR